MKLQITFVFFLFAFAFVFFVNAQDVTSPLPESPKAIRGEATKEEALAETMDSKGRVSGETGEKAIRLSAPEMIDLLGRRHSSFEFQVGVDGTNGPRAILSPEATYRLNILTKQGGYLYIFDISDKRTPLLLFPRKSDDHHFDVGISSLPANGAFTAPQKPTRMILRAFLIGRPITIVDARPANKENDDHEKKSLPSSESIGKDEESLLSLLAAQKKADEMAKENEKNRPNRKIADIFRKNEASAGPPVRLKETEDPFVDPFSQHPDAVDSSNDRPFQEDENDVRIRKILGGFAQTEILLYIAGPEENNLRIHPQGQLSK